VSKKDGPPTSSSGYRFGPLEAFRSGLPPRVAKARGPRTEAELEAGESLAKFNDYFGRARSIGQPLAPAQAISPERAASLEKMQSSSEERHFTHVATLKQVSDAKTRLFHDGQFYMFVEEHPHRYLKSLLYGSRPRAMQVYHWGRIAYIQLVEGPLLSPITGPS
jgi:hypothetical protein